MVTIKDVAQQCGLSTTLVSRYLNGLKGVSPNSRERIAKAIEELNYRPNGIARSLVLQKTQSIGIVVDNLCSPFLAPLIAGLQKGAEDFNSCETYNLIFCSSDGNLNKKRRNIEYLTQGRVDGIIIYGSMRTDDTLIEKLSREKFPFLLIENDKNGVDADKIVIDNEDGAYCATKYLIELGHRRIAHISGDTNTHVAQERYNGYKKALIENKIPIDEDLVVWSDCNLPQDFTNDMRGGNIYVQAGYNAMKTLLCRGKMMEAVFFGGDLFAFGAQRALQQAGIRVPQQLSIIGFDDEMPGLYGLEGSAISTMRQPLKQAGYLGAQTLIARLQNPKIAPQRIVLKTQKILRYTCMPQF